MEATPVTEYTVSYQFQRQVLIKMLFWRIVRRPRRVRSMALFAGAAVVFYFVDSRNLRFFSYALVLVVLYLPIEVYRGVTRIIDRNSKFTDPVSVTFGPVGVTAVGPNYKTETAWSMFKGFSEDDDYFYLHLSDIGFDSCSPKSAFTPEQQMAFRQYAQKCNS